MRKNELKGTIKDLVVIEPSDKEMQFFKGEKKVLKYKLRNSSYHPLKDIQFSARTILRLGEGEYYDTKKVYIKKIDAPKEIPPNTTKTAKVTLEIPFDYNETIVREGSTIEWPCRVAVSVKSLKHIKEI